MNILVTDQSPFLSARNLDDILIIEMSMVTARLLSTVTVIDAYVPGLCPPYSIDTPSVRWLRNDKSNLFWLLAHMYGLLAEYEERFRHTHACSEVIEKIMHVYGYEKPDVKAFQNLTKDDKLGIDYTYMSDTILAYQTYLTVRWNLQLLSTKRNPRLRKPTWTGLNPPEWYKVVER